MMSPKTTLEPVLITPVSFPRGFVLVPQARERRGSAFNR